MLCRGVRLFFPFRSLRRAAGQCRAARLERWVMFRLVELPPKDRTCSGLRLRADELARRLIP